MISLASQSSCVVQQQPVVGQHPRRVTCGAQHPGAQLQLVGAQVQDQVVQLAGHGQRPEPGALGVHRGDVGRGALARAADGDLGDGRGPGPAGPSRAGR